MHINDPIIVLDNIGSKRVSVFNQHGIYVIRDLLYYLPRRHLDRTSITSIKDLKKGYKSTLIVSVNSFGVRPIKKGKMFQVIVSDSSGSMTLVWFNSIKIIKNIFKVGDKLAIHGKVNWYNGYTITHPEFDKLDKQDNPLSTGEIIPIYPLTSEFKSSGIDQRVLRKLIKGAFSKDLVIDDFLPEKIIKDNNLISLSKAIHNIHYSNSLNELKRAINRLKFDEHFFLQLFMAVRRRNFKSLNSKPILNIGPYFKLISESLEFELTKAQKKVLKEIRNDLKSKKPMNRLLQGDVSSGKTIVAILSSAIAVGNNFQVAIMAPTEILARQHYLSFIGQMNKAKVTCALLIGNMKKKERTSIISGIKSNKIQIIIGTHALIQKDVKFKKLNLVIIDEQHRFGVNQRASLVAKGENPNFLAMTATPIPRTLSITYNGDMELSIIDELPLNRIPITTKVINPDRLKRVYSFMAKQFNEGKQAMVIYPLVEESEKSDLAAAVQAHENFKNKIFKKFNVGLVHGRMDSIEKDLIMEKFSKNQINLLVSTTVIEVGVDIPNASVMLIENAERFGLTQLHQLRGRVGRGSSKSYCILVKRKIRDSGNVRLNIMEESNDGFYIADEDLKLRGPGQFFGTKQSGFINFQIASLTLDAAIIKAARKTAFNIVKDDISLKKDSNKKIRDRFENEYVDYLTEFSFS